MLMLRLLHVLLLGLSVFAGADPIPGPQNPEDKPCCLERTGRASGLARHVAALSTEPARQGLDRGQRKSPRSWNLWRSGSEPNSGFVRGLDLKRARMYSGTTREPPSRLERDVSIVIATATKTTTIVTSFIATVLSTATHTLTFINPTLRTQTRTQTVTIGSVLARRKGSPGTVTTGNAPPAAAYRALAATNVLPDFLLARHKRQAGETPAMADIPAVQTPATTVAAATTTTTTTTVTVQAGGTRTRIITIFATVTVAPNAKTTIFTTTTLFTTPQQGQMTSTAIVTSVAEEPTTATNPGATGGITDDPAPGPGTDTAGETSARETASTAAPTTATSLPSTSAVTSSSIPNPSTAGPSIFSSETAGPGTSALTSPTPEPPPRGTAIRGSMLISDQIAGIVLGLIFFIFVLIIMSLLLRRRVIQKRQAAQSQAQAQAQAQTGPERAATAPSSSPAASDSTPGDANRVRVVIRPPPPPQLRHTSLADDHEHGPTLFPDDNNGRSSSPAPPPESRRWSITSDFGGTTGAAAAAAAVRHSGVPSSDVMGRFGGGGAEHGNMTAAAGAGPDAADGRGNGSGNVSGAESGSSGAPRTRLSPPPARSGPGYDVESMGIGRAI